MTVQDLLKNQWEKIQQLAILKLRALFLTNRCQPTRMDFQNQLLMSLKNALAILTVSDHLLTGEATSAEERQNSFTDMMKLALEVAVKMEKN